MNPRTTTLLSLAIALALALAAVALLGHDYRRESDAHEQALAIRGQSMLVALEGGLRTHRRLGGWFEQTLSVTLEELAGTPGVVAIGAFAEDGQLVTGTGPLPERLTNQVTPLWLGADLLVTREMQFSPGAPGAAGPGAGGGRGWGRVNRADTESANPALEKPLRLAVLLDGADYRQSLSRERWRFAGMLGGTLALLGLGLGLLVVLQRQGRLNAELSLAAEKSHRLEELARLGAGLAHETKNPLSLIRGIAQDCLSRPAGEGGLESRARQIVDEADRIVGRINAFLTYSRQPEPRPEPVALDGLLGEMADLFGDEARAKGLTLEWTCPPARVIADPGMLRQALVNLLANALAFGRQGDRIGLVGEADGSGRLDLVVRDSGPGIAPEDLPLVTEPYFTRRTGGTGLGLAIVRQIAEMHGWRLSIDSEPGQGVTARIGGLRQAMGREGAPS